MSAQRPAGPAAALSRVLVEIGADRHVRFRSALVGACLDPRGERVEVRLTEPLDPVVLRHVRKRWGALVTVVPSGSTWSYGPTDPTGPDER